MTLGEAKRRLHPEVFALYRAGKISLDVIQSIRGLRREQQLAAVLKVYTGERFKFLKTFETHNPRSCIGSPKKRGSQ